MKAFLNSENSLKSILTNDNKTKLSSNYYITCNPEI